jgi:hypothetical protein
MWDYNGTVDQLFTDFKDYDPVRNIVQNSHWIWYKYETKYAN